MLQAGREKDSGDSSLMRDAAQSLRDTAQSVHQTAHEAMPADMRKPEWAGIRLADAGIALAVMACAVFIRWLVLAVLNRTLGKLLLKRDSELAGKVFAGMLRMLGYAILLLGFFLALSMLELPHEPVDLAKGVWRFFNTLLIIFGAMLLYRIIDATIRLLGWSRTGPAPGARYIEILPLVRDMAKVVLAVLAAIFIVQSWGYNTSTLIAGVGIGGLALAFAAQDTIANMFGSLVIYADRPFKTGDLVEVSGVIGNVEEVGIRSTRIRTFDKCLVTIPNKVITSEKLYNWGAITHRRMRWSINISNQTEPEELERVLDNLRAAVAGHEHVADGMWLVHLESIGSASLRILVQAYVDIIDYQAYLDCQEQLMMKVIRILAAHGVQYAFPLQVRDSSHGA